MAAGMLLRHGILAAVLVLACVALAAAGHSASAQEHPSKITHTCGLTDREFITDYSVNVTGVGMYGLDYLDGSAKPAEVIRASRDASSMVKRSAPLDPSLRTVKHLAPLMFIEYGKAVRARERGLDPRNHMYKAYNVGARIHDVLHDAEPGLAAKGCDVSDLL
jgi:predicted alpha-1,6-mannanase (GH76 family)